MKKILVIVSALFVLSFTSDKTMDITVKGNSEFAFDLFKKLTEEKKDQNLFFSPFSISSALAMTYGGARGATQDSMAKVLHFAGAKQFIHSDFSQLLKTLSDNENVQLNLVNSLWIQKEYPFRKEYFEMLKEQYGASSEYVDFKDEGEREKARLKINSWVENKTNDKIKDLLARGILKEDSRLVLVNAIYFFGRWANEFAERKTKENPFYTLSGSYPNPLFMNNTCTVKYFADDKKQVVELPYKDNKTSLLIVLPQKRGGIAELEKDFTFAQYQELSTTMKQEKVNLSIPKFKMTCDLSLKKTLSKMGMGIAFSDFANFSGMSEKKAHRIDEIIHKAFIEMGENGTEAAAATAVVMAEITSEAPASREIYFRADHPFLFFIRDNETGSILFFGKVMNPTL